jgi:hypothetical protein
MQKQMMGSLFNNDVFESQVGKATRQCARFMKVRVYRNLNKSDYYSILAMEGVNKGKVVGYARSVLVKECQFKVSNASRLRACREKRRNVHAFCEAILVDAFEHAQELTGKEKAVTYNPFKSPTFYCRSDESPQTENCDQAILQGSDVHIISEVCV